MILKLGGECTSLLLNGEMSKHDGLSQEKLLARISSKW